MNTPVKGCSGFCRHSTSSGASNDSIYQKKKKNFGQGKNCQMLTCEPHPLRAIVIDIAPRSSWPPFFAFSTACESRMAPAHVPHTGFVFTKFLRGSSTPDSRASNAMVVLSANGVFDSPIIKYSMKRTSSRDNQSITSL